MIQLYDFCGKSQVQKFILWQAFSKLAPVKPCAFFLEHSLDLCTLHHYKLSRNFVLWTPVTQADYTSLISSLPLKHLLKCLTT